MVSAMNRAALKHGVTIETSGGSCSHISRIETAGYAGIGGALDDGAAIGEDGEFEGIDGSAEREFIGADGSDEGEAAGEILQIDGTMELMDLDGVAAAQADRRAARSVKEFEFSQRAAWAGGIARRQIDLADLARPDVDGGDTGGDRFDPARENFERRRRLQRRD